MTDAADIARAFNEWTPDRKDLEIATLRARVAELEGLIREFYEQWDGHPGCAGCDVAMDTIERLAGVANSVPTTDPRDARIAEVEQAAIQWRLRVAELETEAQESDARIAELEAALREIADRWATRSPTGAIARRPFAGPDQCAS